MNSEFTMLRVLAMKLPSPSSHANDYMPHFRAQARIQTQQIDSAIQLLRMQYDNIMASVQESHSQALEKSPLKSPSSATSAQIVDHKSFYERFELSGSPSFEVVPANFLDTHAACKRKSESALNGMSIANLVDLESCSPSTISNSDSPSKKRPRRQ